MTGQNPVIACRQAEGKYDRLPALAAELVRLEPQVIVAVSTASARAATSATSTISIVMWGVADPIGEGLVGSLARPGGNVTGFTGSLPFETYAKQLQLLKEAVPAARRIAFRLPTACSLREYTEAGGLMTYSINFADTVRQAAGYVDRLLRGAKPTELPVEGPTKFELVINVKTAKALGLTVPPTLLLQADQVIE